MGDGKENIVIPSLEEIESERSRLKSSKSSGGGAGRVFLLLIVAAAIAVLASYMVFPVVRIYGTSMEPNLAENDIVLCVKTENIQSGDIIAFYHGNKLLLKRVVGFSRDWIEIDEEGKVSINGSEIAEPYLINRSFGESDLQYPYQIPDGKYFVMGDNREISVDSRNSLIGCVGSEQLCGRAIFRVWPLERFGTID